MKRLLILIIVSILIALILDNAASVVGPLFDLAVRLAR